MKFLITIKDIILAFLVIFIATLISLEFRAEVYKRLKEKHGESK